MVERLPLPAAVIVRLGRAGVNRDRARPGGYRRGSVQPVRSRRSRRLVGVAHISWAGYGHNGSGLRGIPYLLRGHRVSLVRGWPVSAILAQLGQLEERSGAGSSLCCGACGRRQSRSALTAGP